MVHLKREGRDELGECCWSGVLPGGLQIYLMPKDGFHRQSALLSVDFGSIDRRLKVPGETGLEREIPAGMAHFLEHLMFQKQGGDIGELFSALGADVDADTTFTGTSYIFSCTDHLEDNLELLLQLAFEPHLTHERIDREREIIFREIQLTEDNLEWVSYFQALGTIFPGHPLSVDIAGTLDEIEKIDLETLELCYRAFYSPSNTALFICGDIAPPGVAGKVEEWLLEKRVREAHPQPHCRIPPPDKEPLKRRRGLPVVERHLSLVFRDRRKALGGAELLKRELALELLLDILFGPGSQFYNSYYDKGVIEPASFGFDVYAEPWFTACLITGDVPDPRVFEKAVIEVLLQTQTDGLFRDDFARAKRKAFGHIIQGYDQVDSCLHQMHSAVSCGARPFDFLRAYHEVEIGDLEEGFEACLDPQRYGFSLIEPGNS